MAILQLQIDGKTAWQMNHDLPILWPWLFDFGGITESRRLHATALDGADLLHRRLAQLAQLEYFAPITRAFEESRPDLLPRSLDCRPDAIISLDLSRLEAQRPYSHERSSNAWNQFFRCCDQRKLPEALDAFDQATQTPLRFTGGRQRDALMLAARAREAGLATTRHGRSRALCHLLFGIPVSRPAKSLCLAWEERLGDFAPAHFVEKSSPIRSALRWFLRPRDN